MDSRYSKGSRSRSSASKKSNSIGNNVNTTAANKYYIATNNVPLYSAVSVSTNQYSVLTKGGRLAEFSKETWSTQINVSQSSPEKPTALNSHQFASKDYSAQLVTSNSSVKAAFQITPNSATNNVVISSAVGKSNTMYALQNVEPQVTPTPIRSKKSQQSSQVSQARSVAKTDASAAKPGVRSTTVTNKSPNVASKSIPEKPAVTASKNVITAPVTQNSQSSCPTTNTVQTNSLKSVPVVASKATPSTSKEKLPSILKKVDKKQSGVQKTTPKVKRTVIPGKKTLTKVQRKYLAKLLRYTTINGRKKYALKKKKSGLPPEDSKLKVPTRCRITKKPIRRRKAGYQKSGLVPSYEVTGKESLIVKNGGVMAYNKNLKTSTRAKQISRRLAIPKVLLQTVHCGPVNTEIDSPFVLPKSKFPSRRYDFKNHILKKAVKRESDEPSVEVQNCCPELHTDTYQIDKYARAEERRLKRSAQYFNPNGNRTGGTIPQPISTDSKSGPIDVHIISESLVNTIRNDIVLVCNNNFTDVSTTNAFLTFHSTMNSCVSASTATTNVTQTTTTPIVSSFVKEAVASTSACMQTPSSSSTFLKSRDVEPPLPQKLPDNTKDASSNLPSKSTESSSKSKSKSKSKESSKSKSKESSKSKSKEPSASHKGKSNSSTKDKLPDLPSVEPIADKIETANNNDAPNVNSQPTPTLPNDTNQNSQTPNVAQGSSSEGATNNPPPKPPVLNTENEEYDFGEDIKNIMYAFGDNDYPDPEAVKMMEVVVREELNGFVYLCEVAALETKAKALHFREVVYTLRREKQRLGRLFRYFRGKERHKSAKQAQNQQGTKEPIITYEPELRKIAEELDETGEYARLFEFGPETTLAECELRADRIVQRLTMPKFLLFSKARSVSFARKMPRLAEWVLENIHANIPLTQAFVDVLGFLTYEIVAELMNMAVLVRAERLIVQPLERVIDTRGLNPDTCMSDPTFFKKRCFGLQSVSEILVQAGELQAMRMKKFKTKPLTFNEEYHKQILPIDVREGYLRYANEHLLEPTLSYKSRAKKLANKPLGRPRRKKTVKPHTQPKQTKK